MAVTVTQSPQYPTTRAPVRLTFALTGGGDFVRVWCTDAPLNSKLKKQLDESGVSRTQIFEGDGGQPFDFEPDVGGRYVIKAQEFTRGASSYGGGYKGDPAGYQLETKVGNETSLTIVVGQRLTMPIGAGADTATLVFWVWDSTIRATAAKLQGELSPAIIEPKSPRAATASLGTQVQTALAALVDVSSNTAMGTPASVVSNMVSVLNAHFATAGSVHFSADTTNTIKNEFASAPNANSLPNQVNAILVPLRRHMLNDAGSGTGSANGSGGAPTRWHSTGSAVADHANVPLFQSVGSIAEAYVALADIWRAYEAHRVSVVAHGVADNTNTLTALSALLTVHRHFTDVLRNTAPSAGASENPGAVALVYGAGMQVG